MRAAAGKGSRDRVASAAELCGASLHFSAAATRGPVRSKTPTHVARLAAASRRASRHLTSLIFLCFSLPFFSFLFTFSLQEQVRRGRNRRRERQVTLLLGESTARFLWGPGCLVTVDASGAGRVSQTKF